MKLKEVLIKAMRITLLPSMQWKNIATEKDTVKQLLWDYSFPLIVFSAIGRIIGLFFTVKSLYGLTWKLFALLGFHFVAWIIIPYVLIIAATYALDFSLPKIGIETDQIRTLKLVVYTLTPLFIITFFIYLHPLMRMLIPFGIYIFIAYILFVFWYGIMDMYPLSLEKRLRFVVVAVLIGVAVLFITQHLYGLILGYFYPNLEAYVK